jgi:hypothetical protein
MRVVAIKDTSSLVKGAKYDIRMMYNQPSIHTKSGKGGKVYLEGVPGCHSAEYFRTVEGEELPMTTIQPPVDVEIKLQFNDLKKGDLLCVRNDQYKTLVKGGIYRIDGLLETVGRYGSTRKKIKLEGLKRSYDFSSWTFRKMSVEEVRDMNLNDLLHGEQLEVINTEVARKIDYVDDPEKLLMSILAEAIRDKKRNSMGIVEWACRIPRGSRMKLKKEDFDAILDMPLGELIKILEK